MSYFDGQANVPAFAGGLSAELQKRNQRLKILSDMASLLLLSDDPRDIIETVFEKLSDHLGLEAYFNYLLVEDGSRMRLANYHGVPPETARAIEWLDFGQAVCGCVARDRARIVAEDVQHSGDARTDLIRSLGITAYCCHPLISHDRLIGTLSFGTRQRPAFAADEVELLYVVCNQVAAALDRHNLMAQLHRSNERLEQKVAERTMDLKVANTALAKTNDTLRTEMDERARAEAGARMARYEADVYLDLMGHDISNMHQIALGNLELALELEPVGGDGWQLLNSSIETLVKSAQMIDSIRKLKATRTGKVEPENVDLGAVLKGVVAEFEKINRHVSATIPDGTYTVCANRFLPEIFSILLGNAVKHSGRADVAVSIGLATAEDRGMPGYKAWVEDNGPGISDDRKAHILRRFSPGDTDTKGIGTGLFIVRSLVESYGGRVWVEDRVQGDHTKGARFVVMLPAV